MMMKQDKDWIDAMRSALRDAEIPPAEGAWERLQRELDGAEPRVPGTHVPEPRKNVWRIYGPRIAAAAAAVLIGVVAGEYLWRPDLELGKGQPAVASWAEDGDSAVGISQRPEPETLRERLAEASGWPTEPGPEAPAGPDARTDGGPGPNSGSETLALKMEPTPLSEPSDAARPETSALSKTSAHPDASALSKTSAHPDAAALPKTSAHPDASALSKTSAHPDASALPKTAAARKSRAAGTTPSRTAADRTRNFDDPFGDSFGSAETRQTRTKASLSLFAGGGMTGGSALQGTATRSYSAIVASDAVSLVGNGDNFSPMARRNYDESSFRHHLPLGCGITVRAELPHGLSIESGVNYTLLRSDVRLRYSSDDVSQKLHFIGVPLRLNWQFVERGRFSAYLGAGGMLEKCISAKFGSETVDESGLQWSATAAIGAQYRLGELVGLYFEPEAAYYFTDTELRTSRSDAPLSISLRVGLRLLF